MISDRRTASGSHCQIDSEMNVHSMNWLTKCHNFGICSVTITSKKRRIVDLMMIIKIHKIIAQVKV